MTTDTAPADSELKARHRAMWALGDYPAVATEIIAELGPTLVAAAGIGPGISVVDVAAGSGNAAIPAALAGANVIATDLCPDLLEVGEAAAADAGATLRWLEADAEHMPCGDGEYDVTMSCVGVMFAPHHQAAAEELLRITRPGGTIALLSWTPEGFIGQMFATMKPYAPPPAPGASPPPLWGDEEHVRALLGDGVSALTARKHVLRVDNFASGAEFRDFFKATYGPTIAVYTANAANPATVAALDADLAALGDQHLDGGVMEWEYLLLTATRA
ncbi:MAG TPA: methyltransferase domain-containing protein [Sporichthya sp.]|nr:methyltransferase domain-containing protein [Sporichthya sp.]